jgi:2-octaprenyl-6-methoxyphenol hydroxylase
MNRAEHKVDYDVTIIGGGLVGASLACALEPLGLRIALIEAIPFRAASQPSYDDRTLALSASSCQILKGLGLWPALEQNATPIREIRVAELDRPGWVLMKPQELGLDRFGHVVEARIIGAALMDRLPGLEGVSLMCHGEVTSVSVGDDAAQVEYEIRDGPGTLRTRLLIGADGAESMVRKSLGIDAERHDYGQTAIICNITPEQAHRGRAFECFTPTGPFAVLPHVNDRCGLVWSVASDEAEALLGAADEAFLALARNRFGDHLGDFLRIGRRSSYPLKLVRAKEDVRPRAVILGNAAHAIHPIGAQGFNLGLRDAAVLAEVLADTLGQGKRDIGRAEVLQRYSQWREPDQSGTIGWSDGMARIFSNPSGLAAAARTAGLLAHSLLPPLRRQLAIRAMGFRGRIPKLALGEALAPSGAHGATEA